ncbi:MAG: GIY-YIG nuclease family protein [bacterium]
MTYVYVLKSLADSNCYIGSTKDLKHRFHMHNKGQVYSTKDRTPFEVVYYEAYKSEGDARKREQNLKIRSRAFGQLKMRIKDSIK